MLPQQNLIKYDEVKTEWHRCGTCESLPLRDLWVPPLSIWSRSGPIHLISCYLQELSNCIQMPSLHNKINLICLRNIQRSIWTSISKTYFVRIYNKQEFNIVMNIENLHLLTLIESWLIVLFWTQSGWVSVVVYIMTYYTDTFHV